MADPSSKSNRLAADSIASAALSETIKKENAARERANAALGDAPFAVHDPTKSACDTPLAELSLSLTLVSGCGAAVAKAERHDSTGVQCVAGRRSTLCGSVASLARSATHACHHFWLLAEVAPGITERVSLNVWSLMLRFSPNATSQRRGARSNAEEAGRAVA